MRHKWDVDGRTRKIAPRGKIIHIGAEEIEVWPERCVDSHRCIQCFFMGKKGCAPRFWGPPTKPTEMATQGSKASVKFRKPIIYLDAVLPSGKGSLKDYLAAQPLVALNDGGFTEQITERIKNRESQLFRTPQPYRVTDEPCKCGYQYPLPWGTRGGKQRYFCPRCRRYWSQFHYFRPPKTVRSYGTCLKCDAANQNLRDGLCLKCYDRACVSTRLKYRHKSLGLCIDCRQLVLKPHIRCPRCLERRLSYYHNHSSTYNMAKRAKRSHLVKEEAKA